MKRYKLSSGKIVPAPYGKYITHEDHLHAQEEKDNVIERLKDEITSLQEEIEGLEDELEYYERSGRSGRGS